MSRPQPPFDPAVATVFSTSQIARALGVCRATVRYWIAAGKLRSFTLPLPGRGKAKGLGERRVTRANLIAFLRDNDLPLDLIGAEVGPGGGQSVQPPGPAG